MATKIGVGIVGDNHILTFCPTVLNKMQLSFLFLTQVCLFIELKKLQFGQFLLFVFVKFRNSYRACLMKQKQNLFCSF